MIKLKKLLSENIWDRKFGEPLPTLRLEQDEPEHFGGGENIKIFDYETKHFDICRSAVNLYQRLTKDIDNTEAHDLIIDSAKELDHIFEMEKAVVRGEELNHDPIKHGVELVNSVSFKLGQVAGMVDDDFIKETEFISFHILVMVERKDSIKISKEKEND
tara:strand:+ start:646 stop:1125 length:480 start_codon:yes stop_codon:yes gene_type:complete